MSGYLGSFEHQIDEKGRLSLPAHFRRETGEQALVLAQVSNAALSLFPQSTWTEMEKGLREAMKSSAAARAWALRVTANAVEVVPDRQGRILVPQKLQKAVDIDGLTLVVGAIDRIELWNPARFEAATAQPVSDAEAERFAQQIFA
jgi:MraZ protein